MRISILRLSVFNKKAVENTGRYLLISLSLNLCFRKKTWKILKTLKYYNLKGRNQLGKGTEIRYAGEHCLVLIASVTWF